MSTFVLSASLGILRVTVIDNAFPEMIMKTTAATKQVRRAIKYGDRYSSVVVLFILNS